ncbi:MAG TPA: DUF624 domain-containing protein [Clostridia bacterium]|nr:DUF624 domain-containing protein [Clostridia bacterium]
MFEYDGPVYKVLSRVSDVVILHLLWLVTSLPLVTLGASLSALYSVSMAHKLGNDAPVSVLYFAAFRSKWKRASLLMAVLVLSGALLVLNLYFWNYVAFGLIARAAAVLTLVFCFLWGLVFMYGFAAVGYTDLSLKSVVSGSLGVAYARPGRTLYLGLCWAAFILLNCINLYVNAMSLCIGFGVFVHAFLARTLIFVLDPNRLKAVESEQVP